MKGKKEYVKAQLVGLKMLPTESGLWGVLLPKPGEKAVAHQPTEREDIEVLNPAVLRFSSRDFDGMNRGYGVALGVFAAALLSIGLAPLCIGWNWRSSSNVASSVLALIVCWGMVAAFATWAYRSARAPMPEPMTLARKLRRFYFWADRKNGWQSWPYDDLVPFAQVNTLVTSAGASTVFTLRLALIDPETREFKQVISPAPPQRTPESCGAIWEFIRRYMDQPPEALPPVRLQPDLNDPAADLARFDRRFEGFITPDHHIAPGILPKLFVGFWSVVDYWQMRAMAWIERTAPRPVPPPELSEALNWHGENPYRIVPPTADELLAWKGQLPRLRWRWRIAQIASTVLWGGLFLFMAGSFLVSASGRG